MTLPDGRDKQHYAPGNPHGDFLFTVLQSEPMTFFHAGILGIIEGLTEFLPISSTAHLVLASALLKIPQTEFLKSFEIVIQLGAILAVVTLYWRYLWSHKNVWPIIIVAFLPTAVIGLLVHSAMKKYLLGNVPVVLWSLFLGGIALVVFELWHREKDAAVADMAQITWKQAFLIGLFQSVAIIPGVSRSAATIVGGLLLGIRRKTIVDFSFILAIPTMAAATGLDLVKSAQSFSSGDVGLLTVGFIVSFVVALGSVLWLLGYIKTHTFISFGVYRIIIAVALALLMALGILSL
jgi:undecaprenyl-diphosphatase